MRRTSELVRGSVATALLATLLIGLPVLLVVTVGWPLPRAVPRVSDLADTFNGDSPLEVTTVWKGLAFVLWLAWAQLLVAVALETAALVRGGLARPLPGLGVAQGLAASLVTASALLWPAGGEARALAQVQPGPVGSAPEVEPPASPARSVAPAAHASESQTEVGIIEHVVQRRDTLWDLAERYLGDGYRSTELFETNRDRVQPDGRALRDPGVLEPGWVLHIPVDHDLDAGVADDPDARVVVKPCDTLWDIAEEHLGDGLRYPEIFDENVGVEQPDGERLTDPDHIEPGWELDLPGTTVTPDSPVSSEHRDEADALSPPVEPSPSAATPAPAPTTTVTDGTLDRDLTDAEEAGEADRSITAVGLVGGGVAMAGVLTLLARRRRAQQRNREPGYRVTPLPEDLDRAERVLHAGADPGGARLLEAALRAAAASTAMPSVRWVEVGDGWVEFRLTDEAPAPSGFVPAGPTAWRSTASVDELDALGKDTPLPMPTLAPVGKTPQGAEVLLDLEVGCVTTITGAEAGVRQLIRSLALAMPSAPWTDEPRVVLVGFDAELEGLPGVEKARALEGPLIELEKRVERVATDLAALDIAGAARARSTGAVVGGLEPLVILNGTAPRPDQTARLEKVASHGGSGGAIITVAPESGPTPGLVMRLDEDGCLHIDDTELEINGRQINEADAQQVLDLLDAATAPADVEQLEESSQRRTHRSEHGGDGQSPLAGLLEGVDALVRVLGEVDVVRRPSDDAEPLPFPKQKSLEAVTYLALREVPVDREDLQAALWPDGTNSAKTLHNTIWAARRTLGVGEDGDDLFPEPGGGHYRLANSVVTDYALFNELVERAHETESSDRTRESLEDALSLVHGEPFVGVGRGYAWVAPHSGIIVAQVVDAAEELAEMYLEDEDWRAAEAAARAGLRAFPCDERLYRILMRAEHGRGSVSAVRRVFEELVARVADPDDGVEPVESVHRETVALLEELTRTDKDRRPRQ